MSSGLLDCRDFENASTRLVDLRRLGPRAGSRNRRLADLGRVMARLPYGGGRDSHGRRWLTAGFGLPSRADRSYVPYTYARISLLLTDPCC
jgi:hypothetical protein